jgi:alpha-tubulin suppressor-like RCC1 family protein
MKTKLTTMIFFLVALSCNLSAQSIGTGLGYHSIAVNSNGTVYTWGYNNFGQLGNETNTNSDVPIAVYTSGVLSGKTITQVAAGGFHSIALASDGTVYTWGYNSDGELGNGTTINSNVPVVVDKSGVLSGKTITQVAGGWTHSIALASNGKVYTWGDNSYRQLGNETNTSSNVPVAVDTSGVLSGKTITQVAAGGYHSIALASDGTVYTWGYNGDGELGNGTNTSSNVPVAVDTSGILSGKTITQVAAGYYYSIALASDGTVYTWGYNYYGQLGNGNTTSSNVPVAVFTSGSLSGKTITQVAAGESHSIALASDGTVYTWGRNTHGQLGDGTNISSNVPVAVNTGGVLSGKTILQVAAGGFHSIALASDGTVYTWGYNYYGQLGNGNTGTNSNLPVAVSNIVLSVELEDIPREFILYQNYPNPFNPATVIKYSISDNVSNVKLVVYDMLGREVATLVNEKQTAGNYEVRFDGSKLASGVYFARLKAIPQDGSKQIIQVRKILLTK